MYSENRCQEKVDTSNEIEQLTKDYLKQGNKITKLKHGESAFNDPDKFKYGHLSKKD